MKFVTGKLNNQYLENLHQRCMKECEGVKVAVAYADNSNRRIFEACINQGLPLEFYGRTDHTVPISPDLLKWFLDQKNPNLQCKLIPNVFHAKVIWWVGAGAYIGSANLTDRSWFQNIEAGTFYGHAELIEHGLDSQLEAFFDSLDEYAIRLTDELYLFQKKMLERRAAIEREELNLKEDFEASKLFPKLTSVVSVDRKKTVDEKYERFRKEWNDTLQIIRDISQQVIMDEYRPDWVSTDAPSGVVADRFLHLYYQNIIKEGASYPVEKHFEVNKKNPDKAVKEALQWWKAGNYTHDYENTVITDWAVKLKDYLSPSKLESLQKAEFKEMASYVHAIRDHAKKCTKEMLGVRGDVRHTEEQMVDYFSDWLWDKHSAKGRTPLQCLHHILWGSGEATQRLWDGVRSDEWSIPHLGMSSLGEMLGWARPDEFPPRNMRTSKTLRALGFDAKVYI